MSWYIILFLTCLCFFIIKTLISFFAGDTDIDFDVDGDIDFDISTLFSFKGILHFLLGFSSFLTVEEKFGEVSSISPYHYLIAIVIGLIFTICLFYLYKLMMKLNHGNSNEIDINGCTCSILINLNDGHYKVLVNTPVGLIEKIITSNDHNLKIGSLHKISKDEQGIYYI